MRRKTSEVFVTEPSKPCPRNRLAVSGPWEMMRAVAPCVEPGFTQASRLIWPEMFNPVGLFRLAYCLRPSSGSAVLAESNPGYVGVRGPAATFVVRTRCPSKPAEPLLAAGKYGGSFRRRYGFGRPILSRPG